MKHGPFGRDFTARTGRVAPREDGACELALEGAGRVRDEGLEGHAVHAALDLGNANDHDHGWTAMMAAT